MTIPVYAYVTKAKPYLIRRTKSYQESADRFVTRATPYGDSTLNGTIPFRFDLNTIDKYEQKVIDNLNGCACVPHGWGMTWEELFDYTKFKDFFAWHMDNLEILDKPLELGDFEKSMKQTITPYLSDKPFGPVISRLEPRTVEIRLPLTRAPQSWMWAWLNGKRVILMSIQSQWAEKIMNGKKTIEVRKTAPKEMK